MVAESGNYRFSDFVRVGGSLTLIVLIVSRARAVAAAASVI